MRVAVNGIATFVCLLALSSGCNFPLPNAWPATLTDVDAIRNDTDLTAQEKRAALEDLGFSPLAINGLLRTERLSNQYGGDLRTAYEKVVAEQFNKLTPDEVQIYADEASTVDTGFSYTLTDVQAQAIVDLFVGQEITSRVALSDLLDDPIRVAALSTDIPDGVLNDVFVEFDSSQLLDQLP